VLDERLTEVAAPQRKEKEVAQPLLGKTKPITRAKMTQKTEM
jgi:hypothetical protein